MKGIILLVCFLAVATAIQFPSSGLRKPIIFQGNPNNQGLAGSLQKINQVLLKEPDAAGSAGDLDSDANSDSEGSKTSDVDLLGPHHCGKKGGKCGKKKGGEESSASGEESSAGKTMTPKQAKAAAKKALAEHKRLLKALTKEIKKVQKKLTKLKAKKRSVGKSKLSSESRSSQSQQRF